MSGHCLTRKHALFLLILPLALLGGRLAFSEDVPLQKLDGPILITAEKMTLKNLEGLIIFEHSVSIKNGELKIDADYAEVFLSSAEVPSSNPDKSGEGREVSKIVATGNVAIKKGLQRAKAEKGVYDRKKEVIVLTGHPEVWDDGYNIKGKVITFFIAEETTLVSESQVVIHQGAEGFSRKKGLN